MPVSGRTVLKTKLKNTSASTKRKPSQQNRKKSKSNYFLKYILLLLILVSLFYAGWHYRYPLYYFLTKTRSNNYNNKPSLTHEMRIFDVLHSHENYAKGCDVSQYQGNIDWELVGKVQDSFQLDFVFIRATAGRNVKDRRFNRNWKRSKRSNLVRGAYHYYRPNENSLRQAENFINTVTLEKGDLPPVLDIEALPRVQSIDSLKLGLKRWLDRVERHYGIKPIIYTSSSFYNDYLYNDFEQYICWIANYNFYIETMDRDWHFWQFTEEAILPGIREKVDLNIYNGTVEELKQLVMK